MLLVIIITKDFQMVGLLKMNKGNCITTMTKDSIFRRMKMSFLMIKKMI